MLKLMLMLTIMRVDISKHWDDTVNLRRISNRSQYKGRKRMGRRCEIKGNLKTGLAELNDDVLGVRVCITICRLYCIWSVSNVILITLVLHEAQTMSI